MKTVLATLNAKYIHMSLALRYLKAYCGREFEIELAEYTIKDPALSVATDLYRRAPDVVGFSCYIWNIEETIDVLRILRKILPGVRVVLGGPEVTYDIEYWMDRIPEADFIVYGEGEETLRHLLSELSRGTENFGEVLGLAYRGAGGEVRINPPRPKLKLDDIPSPHYFEEDRASLGVRVVYFETSRGCPFSCQFCLSSVEVGVRYFSLERTKRDLKHLIRSGARLIKFVDRTFNIRRDYALEVFRFLIENHGGRCVFQFEITADILRPEVLEFLVEHAPPGVFRFEIGVQSTNEVTNEIIRRRQNFEKLARTVRTIRESGRIAQHLDLIAGLPREDYDSFRRTFNDVFALRPEELQLGFLKMLRGTGLRRRAAEFGYVYMDRAPYEVLANDALSFADLVRIKQVEDVLEKYWNQHRMDETIRYLVDRVFPSPFDFFQAFGAYWESRGWEKIGHQLEDLFIRLREFLRTLNEPALSLPVVEGLMKYDYFRNHKYRPRKIWWEPRLSPEEHAAWMRRLKERPEAVRPLRAGRAAESAARGASVRAGEGVGVSAGVGGAAEAPSFASLGLGERELRKQVMIEAVPFDLPGVLAGGEARLGQETLLIARFAADPARPADLYWLPMAEGGTAGSGAVRSV